ncbi:hypothetical protein Sango_0263000 [Sesamum angolense]|uniref:Retrotransposon gag domain-containing protein n=1 Tax=Sesamum angolense TaxID=2727404 RepID=A0AAE1XH79_9LAMI|nr:hypothetical protein Sango_0263000 [Sesamum angolense]
MAQFVANRPMNPPPPSPGRSRELSSTPEEEEHRQEEGGEDPYVPLAVAPPRRSPFAPAILAKTLPVGVKVSNLSEYNGTGDPQEHFDKLYAKIDWYDLSDAPYCKVFRTTLSKRALAWFNQLPVATIFNLEQLTQCFLHHFSMNKRVPKRLHSYSPYAKRKVNPWGDSVNARKALSRAERENHGRAPKQVYSISSDKLEEILFGLQDLDPNRSQNNDTLVISATLSNFYVKKVLINSESSIDVIFYDSYVQLGIDNAQLRSINTPLTGFSSEMIEPLGEVTLLLSFGSYPKRSTKLVKFLVIKVSSTYNIILETPSLNLFRAITSTPYMKGWCSYRR